MKYEALTSDALLATVKLEAPILGAMLATMGHEDAYGRLVQAVRLCGFPDGLADALEAQLTGEASMLRMAAYLETARPTNLEEIADEAIAICELRDAWVERKKSAWYNEKLNEFYNRPHSPTREALP